MFKSSSNTSLCSLEDAPGCRRVSSGVSSPACRPRSPSPAPTAAPRMLTSSPLMDNTNKFERRSLSTVAAIPPLLTEAPTLLDAFQQEWELESTMHVNGFTALQCEAEFGFPKVPAEAPKLQDASSPAQFQRVPSLGACLATPVEMNTGSRAVAANFLSARAYHVQEEVVQCMDRWSDWVRRIRRKRRLEQVQALLSMLDRPAAILQQDRLNAETTASWDEEDQPAQLEDAVLRQSIRV